MCRLYIVQCTEYRVLNTHRTGRNQVGSTWFQVNIYTTCIYFNGSGLIHTAKRNAQCPKASITFEFINTSEDNCKKSIKQTVEKPSTVRVFIKKTREVIMTMIHRIIQCILSIVVDNVHWTFYDHWANGIGYLFYIVYTNV